MLEFFPKYINNLINVMFTTIHQLPEIVIVGIETFLAASLDIRLKRERETILRLQIYAPIHFLLIPGKANRTSKSEFAVIIIITGKEKNQMVVGKFFSKISIIILTTYHSF